MKGMKEYELNLKKILLNELKVTMNFRVKNFGGN